MVEQKQFFDEFIPARFECPSFITSLVVHRNTDGVIFAAHSPLDRGPVGCKLCETPGTKVYV